MENAVGVMEHVWLLPSFDGMMGERMQFGALGSTVQGPEVTVKNGDGGDGYEHTRQPEWVTSESEDHWIVPGPKMNSKGPPPPWKLVSVPDGWLGMRRKS